VVEIAFTDLLIVVAAGFAAPFALGLVPGLRLPAVVLEIVLGILLGPSVLGWVEVDEPVGVVSLIGLAFLLFLAGLEIDLRALRGRLLRAASLGFAVSLALALVAGFALDAAGVASEPLLIAVILASTSLGVIVPVLADAGEARTPFGQLVIAAASIADFASVLLLSLLFSGEATGTSTKVILLGAFVATLAAVAYALAEAERSSRISAVLVRLQDTSAQIRVRGAFVLLIGMVALAEQLGLELILGAFAAGAIVNLLDRDEGMTHPEFRAKLAAVGFGVFIPVFFVTSGVRFDGSALFADASAIAAVPAFLAALVLARGVPAALYRRQLGTRRAVAAGLLQATSLPFIVAATAIGQDLGLLDAATSAGFVTAGLLSVLAFPLTAVTLLRGASGEPAADELDQAGDALADLDEPALR
jgi:Kef-type K+ transport system membrane component KefB